MTAPTRFGTRTKTRLIIASADPIEAALAPLPLTLTVRVERQWEKVTTFIIALCTVPLIDKRFFDP